MVRCSALLWGHKGLNTGTHIEQILASNTWVDRLRVEDLFRFVVTENFAVRRTERNDRVTEGAIVCRNICSSTTLRRWAPWTGRPTPARRRTATRAAHVTLSLPSWHLRPVMCRAVTTVDLQQLRQSQSRSASSSSSSSRLATLIIIIIIIIIININIAIQRSVIRYHRRPTTTAVNSWWQPSPNERHRLYLMIP